MDRSERQDTAQRALLFVGVAVAIVVLLVVLWYALDVVLLAFVGVLLALLLRAAADWLSEHTPLAPGGSLALVGVAFLLLLAGGALLFGNALLAQTLELYARVPEIIAAFRDKLGESEPGRRVVELIESGGESGQQLQFLGRGLGFIGSLFGVVANFLIILFFAIFLAAQPRLYVAGLLAMVPKRKRERMGEVLAEVGHMLRRWLVGQSLLALVVGVITSLGLTLLGVPYAVPLGVLAGVMEFVPYVGPFVAAIPAILVGFGESPQLAAWIALFYVALQILESYALAPLVQHKASHVPPALVIFSQVLMGVIVGPLGVAVATPLAAAALVAVSKLYVEDALGDRTRST